MKTFWVLSKKSSERIRPRAKSPSSSNRKTRFQTIEKEAQQRESWPRHRSVPVVSTPFKEGGNGLPVSTYKSSLTPERWPELDESLSSPCPRTARLSLTNLDTRSPKQSIDISDVGMIQSQLMNATQSSGGTDALLPNVPDELKFLASGNLGTLTEFAKLAEENAQRSRLLANWASSLVTVAQQRAYTQGGPPTPNNDKPTNKDSLIPSVKTSRPPNPPCPPRRGIGSSVDKEDNESRDLPLQRTYCVIS